MNRGRGIGRLVLMTVGLASALPILLDSTAVAQQPTNFVDLGTLVRPQTSAASVTLGPVNRVQWVQLVLALNGVNNALPTQSWLDIDTTGGTFTSGNTVIALYNSTGAVVASDDDDGPNAFSQLTFGLTGVTRPAIGNSLIHNGRDGAVLASGTYWLAITGFPASFAPNWAATSGHAAAGSVDLRVQYGVNAPTGVGLAVPGTVNPGQTARLQVAVTPAAAPTSVEIQVRADLTCIGGASSVSLLDNGVPPDQAGGDNIFNVNAAVPPGTPPGTKTIPFTVSDVQGRSSRGSFDLIVTAPTQTCCGGEEWHHEFATYPQGFSDTESAEYDSVRQRVIGVHGRATTMQTFEFVEGGTRYGRWVDSRVTGPAGREGFCTAFDSVRGVLVAFGGFITTSGLTNETWEYNGTSWTRRTPATSPTPRRGAAMTFDAARGRVVMFGGESGAARLADTWEWNGTNWQLVNAPGPSARSFHAMAYDPDCRRVMMFGGSPAPDSVLSDLWEYNGAQWTLAAPSGSGPRPRAGASMVYQPECGQLFVYGGFDPLNGGLYGESWTWDRVRWTQRTLSDATPGAQVTSMVHASHWKKTVLLASSGTPGISTTFAWYTDCNRNGVADAVDLSSGTSQDCNTNCVPDECECGTLDFNGGWDGPETTNFLWERELSLLRFKTGKVGDAFGQGEVFLVSTVKTATNTNRTEFHRYPTSCDTWKQKRAKTRDCTPVFCIQSNCTQPDLNDNDATCYWHYFNGDLIFGRPDPSSPAALQENTDHSVGPLPSFCQPLTVELVFSDHDNFWEILGRNIFLTAADFLIDEFPDTQWFLQPIADWLEALNVKGNAGKVTFSTMSPTPTSTSQPTFCCDVKDLSTARSKVEVKWRVFAKSGNFIGSPNSACLVGGDPPPESPNDLTYFSWGYGESQVSFYAGVRDQSLLDPASFNSRRVIHFFLDLDNNRNTGSQRPLECGADCQVTIEQQRNTASPPGVDSVARIYCWRCPCPGQPVTWVLENGQPYDLAVRFSEVAVSAALSDLRNPAGVIAAWSVLENGGAYVSSQPGPDPCTVRLPVAPLPDVLCPWVTGVNSFDVVTGAVANPVRIRFHERMAAIASNDLVLSPPLTPLRVSMSADRLELRVFADNLSGRFPPGEYTLTLSGDVTDLARNRLDGLSNGTCGNPFRTTFCVPDLNSTTASSTGVAKRLFAANESVYVRGSGITPGTYRLHAVFDGLLGAPGSPLVHQGANGAPVVVVPASGILPLTNLGPMIHDGEFNVIFDNGDGLYQLTDRMLNPCEHAFVVGRPCSDTLDGIAFWMPFDETTETGPFAELIEGNHGRLLAGASLTVPGVVGRALTLTGTNYVQVPNSPDLNVGTGDFSFAYWVRLSAANASGVRSVQDYRGSVAGYHMFLNNGNPSVNLSAPGGFNNYVANRNVADGNWHHVTVSIERNSTTGLKIYVDGTLAGTFNPTARNGNLNDTAPFRIGSRSATVSGLFTGSLDEVMLFDRALPPNEAQFIYLRGPRGICLDRPQCVADFDDGSGTGTPDGGVTIDDLLFYVGQFSGGTVLADVDDGSGTNTPDGGVTIDDLLYFLQRYDAGC